MRRNGDLVKVLSLIDDSLNDLNASSKQHHHSHAINPTTSYLNTLTRDLLTSQKNNASLIEENQVLKRRLNMQNNHNSPTYSTYSTYSSRPLLTGNALVDARTTTLSECVSSINRKVDAQAKLLKSKQVDGTCSLAHTDVQASLDRCLSQLQRFREGELMAKRQREELFSSAERDRDKLAAAMLEIQHLQGERRGMEERLEAFELENMRLTNDLSMERQRTNGATAIVSESKLDMKEQENRIEELLQEINHLKNKNMTLVNERDETRNLTQGI